MTTTLDDAIAEVERAGMTVVRPRGSKDEQLASYWNSMLVALNVAEDLAETGGRLHVPRPTWLSERSCPIELTRAAVLRKISTILATAVVTGGARDAA